MCQMAKRASRHAPSGQFHAPDQARGRPRRADLPAGAAEGRFRIVEFHVETALDLVTRVEAGLPYQSFEALQAAAGLEWKELSDLVRIPPRTLARRRGE